MRSVFLSLFLLAVVFAQGQVKIDSSYANAYYKGRMELFESLGGQKGATVFLGNSITEKGSWHELFPGKIIMNRGIGGDNTFGVLARLEGVISYRPRTVFLLIGINDIGRGLPVSVIASNYRKIVERIRQGSPATRLYVQSVLPLNEGMLKAAYLKNRKDSILKLNDSIRTIAADWKVTYVDLHPLFADAQGVLKEEMSVDGIHLSPKAYVIWAAFLRKRKYL